MSQILLIEPDKPLARTYSSALKSAGHRVNSVTNSQEAIHIADKATPDVVVLEIQLAGHSGIEFLYEFKSYPDWQNIPVLVLTNVPYMELKDSWPIMSEYLSVKDYKYKPTTSLSSLISSINDLVEVYE